MQRVLILRASGAAAEVEILRGLQEEFRARYGSNSFLQSRDDLVRRRCAFVARLERDEHLRVVLSPSAADEGAPAGHIGIAADYVCERAGQTRHFVERDVLGALRRARDDAGVLLRKESFRNRERQNDRGCETGEEHAERELPMTQGDVQSVGVALLDVVEG